MPSFSYETQENAGKSQETYIKNIRSIISHYPAEHENWSLILSEPKKFTKKLQSLVIMFNTDLQKVKQKVFI